MMRKSLQMTMLGSLVFVFLPTIKTVSSVSKVAMQNVTMLQVTVVGKKADGSHAPIADADVYVRSNDGQFEANAPTNSQGSAIFSDVPHGKYVIQVTAAGWEPNGEKNYDLSKKEQAITIQLKSSSSGAPTPSPSPTPSLGLFKILARLNKS